MKKVFGLVLMLGLFALPVICKAQMSGVRTVSFIGFQPTTNIPANIIEQVLTMAAPYYDFTPDDFIRLYEQTNLVTVTQIGPSTYLVVYGGLGIQIVVDGARLAGASTGLTVLTGQKR